MATVRSQEVVDEDPDRTARGHRLWDLYPLGHDANGSTGETGETVSRIAVVVTHGMGSHEDRSFSDGLERRLRSELDDRGLDSGDVVWCPILWADLVEDRQKQYLDDAKAAGPLAGFFNLRSFVVSALGDASAYQMVGGRPTSTYDLIHTRIRDEIHRLYVDRLGSEPVPMVVAAHSLGGHIMSNYIWDTQNSYTTGAASDADEFERMEWLAAIVTFGCNIPLFTFAFEPVEPICFPGRALADHLEEKAVWRNFYDRHDVLGYPLRPLGKRNEDGPPRACDHGRDRRPRYEDIVDQDVEIDAGAPPLSWTPLSHSRYWEDGGFVTGLADVIVKFI